MLRNSLYGSIAELSELLQTRLKGKEKDPGSEPKLLYLVYAPHCIILQYYTYSFQVALNNLRVASSYTAKLMGDLQVCFPGHIDTLNS